MIPEEIRRMQPMTGKDRLGAERDSEYMGAEDIEPGTEPILTIAALYRGMVTLSRGKEKKELITFAEESVPGIRIVRPLIVNATNRKTMRKLYKEVTADALVGKKIQLYLVHNVRDPSTGDKVDGIRIRDTIPKAGKYVAPKCENCGKEIQAVGGYSAEQVADINLKRYGKKLCGECSKKVKAEQEAKAAEEAAKQAEAEAPVQAEDAGDVSDALMAGM